MKIVVLATEGASTWLLINALRKDYPDLKLVFELPVSRVRIMWRRLWRLGIAKVFGQCLFVLYLPILRRESKTHALELIEKAGFSNRPPSDLFLLRFISINSEACISWLSAECPDVVILNGTRIASPGLLAASDAVYLNTHCGITPAYRGVHGGYWAVYQRDQKNTGVTIHTVDKGIDTGAIVFQANIEIDEEDNFFTYPIKQYIAGIPLMRQALKNLAEGRPILGVQKNLPSVLWHHPTLLQYLFARWFRGIR